MCRMLNNFCLKFGSANFEIACSETDESICTTRYQTLYHSFLAKFPSNQRFTKEITKYLVDFTKFFPVRKNYSKVPNKRIGSN